MDDNTPNLDLPYLMAAQAQKHVTHNEALRALDAVVQLSVEDRDLAAPPLSPSDGDRYIIGASASGDWAGHEGEIVAFQDNAWMFYAPLEGWLCWIGDEDKLVVWTGATWSEVSGGSGGFANPVSLVGINTTASDPDKLSVKSDTVLFSHDDVTPGTGDIQTNLNKAGETNTASFLFQNNWSGRAEIGLTGDDDFHFKVSDDGSTWHEGLKIDKTSGAVSFPAGITAPPQPDSLAAFDKIYVDAVNGDDANDGLTAATAVKTAAGLAGRYTIGRKLNIRLLSDLTWDYFLQLGYVVPQLEIYGRNATDTAYVNRKITVVDATNNGSHPGGFQFLSFASVYTFSISVDLNTSRTNAFFNFYNGIGYLRTHSLTLQRLGTGQAVLFANGSSFVPSQHTSLVIDASATGYVARGIAAGSDPNADWRYPSNVTSF